MVKSWSLPIKSISSKVFRGRDKGGIGSIWPGKGILGRGFTTFNDLFTHIKLLALN